MSLGVSHLQCTEAKRSSRSGSLQPVVMFLVIFVLILGFMLVQVILGKAVLRSAQLRAQEAAMVLLLAQPAEGGEVPAGDTSLKSMASEVVGDTAGLSAHPFFYPITESDVSWDGTQVTVSQRTRIPTAAVVSATARGVPARQVRAGTQYWDHGGHHRGIAPLALDLDRLGSRSFEAWFSLDADSPLSVVRFSGYTGEPADYLPYLLNAPGNGGLELAPPSLEVGDRVHPASEVQRQAFVDTLEPGTQGAALLVCLVRDQRVVGFSHVRIAQKDLETHRVRLDPVSSLVSHMVIPLDAQDEPGDFPTLPPQFGALLSPQCKPFSSPVIL